jgi:Amt family ammonium transporter
MGATFSKGVVHPRDRVRRLPGHLRGHHLRLIVGAFAERIKFSACCCSWCCGSPSATPDRPHGLVLDGPGRLQLQGSGRRDDAKAGLIWQWGALDFAGGTVVHINAAVAGLVGAYMVGKRIGYGKESMAPHSLTLTMVGASLLWVGWFGFNAGSALEANGFAALAFINTFSPRPLRCWPGASVKR